MALRLHPNLARIAVDYNDIFLRCARNEIDAPTANRQIRNLSARDDDGVMWYINPADGGWMYRSREGEMVSGQPPAWGLATLTPHDVTNHELTGSSPVLNPDSQLRFQRADPDRFQPAHGLRGAARRAASAELSEGPRRPRWLYPLVVAVAVAVALALAVPRLFPAPDGPAPVVSPLAPSTSSSPSVLPLPPPTTG